MSGKSNQFLVSLGFVFATVAIVPSDNLLAKEAASEPQCRTIVRTDGTRRIDCRTGADDRSSQSSTRRAVPRSSPRSPTVRSTGAGDNATAFIQVWDTGAIPGNASGGRTTVFLGDTLNLKGVIERPRSTKDRRYNFARRVFILADSITTDGRTTLDFAGDPMRRRLTQKVFTGSRSPLSRYTFRCSIRGSVATPCIPNEAAEFCKRQGYEKATSHLINKTVIDRQTVPSRPAYTKFSRVTCERNTDPNYSKYGSGTNVYIVARTIDCRRGKLAINASSGKDGATHAGRSGQVHIAIADTQNARKCISVESRGSRGRERAPVFHQNIRAFLDQGTSGAEAIYGDWLNDAIKQSVSQMERAAALYEMQDVRAAADLGQNLLRIDTYPIPDAKRASIDAATGRFRAAQRELLPRLWAETISSSGRFGRARTAQVFFDAEEKGAWIAPDRLLVRRLDSGGKAVLGQYLFDPDRPDRIELTGIVADLVVDDRSMEAITQELEKRGIPVMGQFSAWTIKAIPQDIPGVRRVEATGGNSEISVSLEIDTGGDGIVALQRLASTGIPIELEWVSLRHSEISGVLGPINLTLAQQTQSDLVVEGREASNPGTTSQQVDYIYTSRGKLRELRTPIVIEPEMSASLGSRDARVPPGAVQHLIDPTQIPQLFEQANADGLIQQVQVINRLGSDALLGALDFVEVRVAFDGGNGTQEMEPFRLSSRGTFGSEKLLSFFSGPSTPRISGTVRAVFDDGSEESFAIAQTSDLVVMITPDLLEQRGAEQ